MGYILFICCVEHLLRALCGRARWSLVPQYLGTHSGARAMGRVITPRSLLHRLGRDSVISPDRGSVQDLGLL